MKYLRYILLSLFLISSAFAKVWTVTDSVATIQAAIDTAMSGDTVLVKNAFQNVGPVEIVGKKIVLLSRAYMNNPSTYNIVSGTALYDTLNNRYLLKISSADSTVVKGFLFDKSNAGNGGGILIENSPGVQLEGVYFNKNRLVVDNASVDLSSVQFYGSDSADYDLISVVNTSLDMKNVIIKNSTVNHLIVSSGGSELDVVNMAVYGNSCAGELYQIGSSTAYFDFITSYGNTMPGASWSFNSTWTSIRNSVLEYAPPVEIGQCEINYSAVPGAYPGNGNLSLDPMVDVTGAFPTLLATSPCISAADPDTNGIMRTDIRGNMRPNPAWAPPDMGAYESERHMLLNDDHHFWISLDGDDIWGNGSEAYPFASLQAAVDYALDADTLLLLPGTYISNTLIDDKSLTIASQYLFEKNTAYKDSVILLADTSLSQSILLVRNTDSLKVLGLTMSNGRGRKFYNNYSFGGAVYCENSQLEMEYLDLADNRSDYCGGAVYALNSDLYLKDVNFNDNASYLGGAMAMASSAAFMDHVVFDGNTASSGGAVYIDNNSKIVAFYSEFSNNRADTELAATAFAKPSTISQYGGAIFGAGSQLRLHNTLINNNQAVNQGAAIALNYGVLHLVQSTLANNDAGADSSGVVYVSDPSGDVIILNSVLWDPGEREVMLDNADLVADHSLIFGGLDGILIDDNSSTAFSNLLDVYPALDQDLNYLSGSPCINAGTDTYILDDQYLIHYDASEYDGSAPSLGRQGANPAVYFELRSIESAMADLPEHYEIMRAYPNPFNPVTTLEFALENDGYTRLSIYNLRGEYVMDIFNRLVSRGMYKLTFDASSLPSGIYIARLTQNERPLTNKKLLLVK